MKCRQTRILYNQGIVWSDQGRVNLEITSSSRSHLDVITLDYVFIHSLIGADDVNSHISSIGF